MEMVKSEIIDQKPDINVLKVNGNYSDDVSNQTSEEFNEPICPYSSQNGNVEDVRKFHILDETEDSDSEKSMSYDSDIPDEEIDRMLEDALFNKRKASEAGLDNSEKQPFEEKDKVVLIEKCQNHFDVLPEGWIQVTHNSGMPLYLHKNSRVCTLAKPYFLGPGSVRKHEIPLSAIPCLSYRRALESEKEKESETMNQELPNARIETVKENIESQNLKPEDVRSYAEKLFEFKTIKVMRFKSWSERRQFTKKRKHEKQLQRPNLPAGTKLITFPIQNSESRENTSTNTKKEWIMNPNGKSYVCILHEYVQHALKKQPTYKFTELENAATPYAATVSINDMQYGIGYGTSKKQAKSEAARATLEILIPEMKSKITIDAKTGSSASKDQDQDLSFFDEIRIEDPRVAEFCAKTTEPSPHDILLTCLQRNFGLNDLQISYQGNTLKNKKKPVHHDSWEAHSDGSVQEQKRRETESVSSDTTGPASAHHVVGVPAEALRKRFREEFQRKKVGRAGNHAVAEQSGNKLSKFRHLGQTETGTVETEGQEKTNQADRGPDTDRVGQSAQAIVV
jgi:microprocessor complex subunit DGCR8